MSLPTSQTVTAVNPPRASSIRSVASNSSIGSGTSLTRRSRIRTRTKTLAGASSRPDNLTDTQSELPYLGEPLVNSPGVEDQFHSRDIPSGIDVQVPARPPRSPQRMGTRPEPEPVDEKGNVNNQFEGVGCPIDVSGVATEPTLTGTNVEADKLPDTKSPIPTTMIPDISRKTAHPPSAFTRVEASVAPKFRDSVLTQQSFTSSSVYPQSTSTASGTESPPSPRSMAEQHDNNDISSFDPDVDEVEEFDGDDVSYRLRLLVKNNYFLPPAHSKPLPSDFASPALTPKKSARAAAPTFLDLFRVGKSKSKPSSPDGSREPLAPILRTTSDSTTASGYVPRPQARSVPQTPLLPHPTPRPQGRVVVVRERMSDLISAAKQAEQEMKARGGRRDHGSQIGRQQDVFDDVIDPTDAVDLPPPSANYPFTVQASALHGLGVHDSVGAALLAETLPPVSPGASSHDPVEAAWRKALLHEAVNHSLQNSPMSTPIASPQPPSQAPSRSLSGKRLLGQRILHQSLLEQDDSPEVQPSSRHKSDPSQSSSTRGRPVRGLVTPESPDTASRPSSYLPSRAETPAALPTPLAPPPRRQIINPLYSLSQTDLPNSGRRQSSSSSGPSSYSKVIRRAVSSPRLSSTYESDIRDAMAMTPPPLPRLRTTLSHASQSRVDSSFDTNRALTSVATTSDSHYSDDMIAETDEQAHRPSMTLSLPTDGRPSLSDYSQPSPTASAFHDALNMPYNSSTPSVSYQAVVPRTSNSSPAPRYSTMSPPPRVSSSVVNVALSPPPRTSSLQNIIHTRISTSPASGRSPASSDPGHTTSTVLAQPILAPEPTTPPSPIMERRGVTASTPLSLHIPSGPIPMAIHSAPPPSSPTSFFDHIQTHPNAMDDLDSSSEEGDAEEEADEDTTAVFVNPQTRTMSQAPISPSLMSLTSKSSFMRLGNHSTPHVARSYGRRPSLPYGPTPTPSPGLVDRLKPVGNVPPRAAFFNDKKSGKSDQGHTPPISTFDFYQYAQQHPATSQRRPQTAGDAGVRAWQSNQRAQASLRRLDGMVIQHMEAEKNTIKRIATSALQTKT